MFCVHFKTYKIAQNLRTNRNKLFQNIPKNPIQIAAIYKAKSSMLPDGQICKASNFFLKNIQVYVSTINVLFS